MKIFQIIPSESILETFYDLDKFGDIMKTEMGKYEEMLKTALAMIRMKYWKRKNSLKYRILKSAIGSRIWILDIKETIKNFKMINFRRAMPPPKKTARASFDGC